MKRSLIFLFIAIILFVFMKNDVVKICQESFFAEQKPYLVKRQQFFDKLSLRYYGTEKYSETLDLVNNHFEITDFITDEVNMIVPCLDAIQRLERKQTLLAIEVMPEKVVVKAKLEHGLPKEVEKTETHVAKIDVIKGSMIYFLFGIFLISGFLSLLSFYKLQKRIKQKKSGWFPDEDDEPIITDDSVLLDFDLSRIESNRYNN